MTPWAHNPKVGGSNPPPTGEPQPEVFHPSYTGLDNVVWAGPPRTSPFDPLVQLGSSQFGSNLVANCAVYAVLTGLSGH